MPAGRGFSRDDASFNGSLVVDGAEFRMVGSSDINSMTSLAVTACPRASRYAYAWM